MCEKVTVDIDVYLEYKKCYDYVQSLKNNEAVYQQRICDLHYENEYLRGKLSALEGSTESKLFLYNKAKHGSFSDKLDFLFSKE